jgi:hypothetical protein
MHAIPLSTPWPRAWRRPLQRGWALATEQARRAWSAWQAARRVRAEQQLLSELEDAVLRDIGMPWAAREQAQALREAAQRRWLSDIMR